MKSESILCIAVLSVILVSSANRNASEQNIESSSESKSSSVPETKITEVTAYETSLPCSHRPIDFSSCPSEVDCDKLGNECLDCSCDLNCQYGQENSWANCTVPKEIECKGSRTFQRKFTCAYCYLSDNHLIQCDENFECESVADPQDRLYNANCNVSSTVLCLGSRRFPKQRACNWTRGHRWLTTLILSITLGGFGADRLTMNVFS